MGKKAKKKARTPVKENRTATLSKKVSEHLSEGDAKVVKEKQACVHFEKGLKLDKVLDKIKSSQQIKCQECREGVHEKRGTKAKGKRGISSSETKSDNKAIWVCLECGHYVCGGVGLPTGSQSHVVRHIRLTRHRLVIQWQNPHLRWCFPCHSLLPVEKEENGEKKDVLLEVVKSIKEQSSKTSAATDDTEELCSGSGSITSGIKLEGAAANGIEARDGYVVRGLVNLGNTCFFNSIMQNLLSLDQLRDHFLKEDMSSGGGPLFSSLKKLFAETKPEAGVKSVINPRSFFGSFCSKAPQFRGYDQHDSHELLRCLLDGLSTEESASRKKRDVSDNDVSSSSTLKKSTLIDSVFGGETSSIVSCMECGHSSKVYEPFLDLSLPIPFKKTPPKKPQAISRAKKAKLPPKKGSKNGSKVCKGSKLTPTKALSSGKDLITEGSGTSSSIAPIDNGPVLETSSVIAPDFKQTAESATQSEAVFDSFWLDIIGPGTSEDETNLEMQDDVSYSFPKTKANGSVPGPDTPATSISSGDQTSENNYERLIHDNDGCKMQDNVSNGSVPGPDIPASTSVSSGDRTLEDNYERLIHDNDGCAKAETIKDEKGSTVSCISREINHASANGGYHGLGESSSSVNPWDDDKELPLMVADSQVLYMPYKEDISYDDKTVSEDKGNSSSSFVGGDNEQNADSVDIGGLFAEPEVSSGPVFGPPSKAEVSGVSFTALSSESDPEEIDDSDSDSPVSVERCLSHFTKPEILSDVNAWNCENCSRNLKLQRLRQKRKSKDEMRLSDTSNRWMTKNGTSSASDQCENGLKHKTLPNCKENVMEKGVSRDTDVSEFNQDRTDTSDVNVDHNSNGKEGISSYSANDSESEGSEDEEAVDSEKLIVKRDATKRVLINKTPPVLTVHLKRFSQDHRGRLSKLSGHVAFKEFIDLRPYMNARCIREDRHVYRLAGLVEHSGTMRGGHYVAYVRGGYKESSSVWYHVSDAYVRQVSLEKVLRSEAYILFYEQISQSLN